MKTVYIQINEDNKVIQLSYSRNSEEEIEIQVDEDHEILMNPFVFYYIDDELVKNIEVQLNGAKEKKDKELNLECQKAIIGGFKYTIDGIEYHFSYDHEAQLNFQTTLNFMATNSTNGQQMNDVVWTVRENGEYKRIPLSYEQLREVYFAGINHKNNMISKYRDFLFPILQDSQTIEEVEAIVW